MRSILPLACLPLLLTAQPAFANSISLACPASNGTTSNGSQCNDTSTLLGMSIIRVTDPTAIFALGIAQPAGYDPATHLFVSPLLYDQNTVIGRSAPFAGSSTPDTGGTTVGVTNGGVTALTGVTDPGTVPSGFPTGNNDEIHTAILAMNMSGGGFSVLSGAGILSGPNQGVASLGEIESTSCASIATSTAISSCPGASDFPAKSFFDVFVDIAMPVGNFHNNAPVVNQATITGVPPTGFYGQSAGVALYADSANALGETMGTQFGTLILGGTGANYTMADAQSFGTQMQALVAADTSLSSADISFLNSQISMDTAPEPSTVMLMLAGTALLGARKLRFRRS